MLNKLSDDIRECYARAEECATRAKAEPNAESREEVWEKRWLMLARNYEFSERLNAFPKRQSPGIASRIVSYIESSSQPGLNLVGAVDCLLDPSSIT